jgi:hypothetical protein
MKKSSQDKRMRQRTRNRMATVGSNATSLKEMLGRPAVELERLIRKHLRPQKKRARVPMDGEARREITMMQT